MGKRTRGRLLAGILAAALLCTAIPQTAYAVGQAEKTAQGQTMEESATGTETGEKEKQLETDNGNSEGGTHPEDRETLENEKTPEEGEGAQDEKNPEDGDAPGGDVIPSDAGEAEMPEYDNVSGEENESETPEGEADSEKMTETEAAAENMKTEEGAEESETESDTEEELTNAGIYNNVKSIIGDDYPYKNYCAGCHETRLGDSHNDYDPWGFFYRQCTSFVAWRLRNQKGVEFNNGYRNPGCNCGDVSQNRWGHAYHWGCAARSLGITVDNTPRVGSIWWSNQGPYGHVAWVAEVNGDQVTIEEYNWNVTGGYGKRPLPASSATGYIHINIIPPDHGVYWEEGYYPVIPDGDYHIVSALGDQWWLTNAGFSTDNGGNVQLWEYDDMECDHHLYHFEFIPDGKGIGRGFYKVTNKYSGKCLDSEGGHEYLYNQQTGKRTNVWQWEDNGGGAQQ